jgi:hypothetical protein
MHQRLVMDAHDSADVQVRCVGCMSGIYQIVLCVIISYLTLYRFH